jgi:flagellar biosynthetic protein FliQ
MSEQDIIDLLRACIASGVRIGAPMMLAALVMGVVIGLAQALTSIQEMTLTFAPKLVVMLIVFALTAASSARILVDLFETRIIPAIGGF